MKEGISSEEETEEDGEEDGGRHADVEVLDGLFILRCWCGYTMSNYSELKLERYNTHTRLFGRSVGHGGLL